MKRGVIVGAGYFASYQLEAWSRTEGAEIVGLADLDVDRARALATSVQLRDLAVSDDAQAMLNELEPDFVDIVTPPATHMALVAAAAKRGIDVICQKPVAPTMEEAEALFEFVAQQPIRFMVHENWRWQPWYRATKNLLDDGTIGTPLSLAFTLRTGDGWQHDAYLDRQPYFREYPRLLLHETGVHFFDTFRYLLGEVTQVFAQIARRNPDILGEDAAQVMMRFASGATATLDASRYNEADEDDARYTFGTMRLDTDRGHLTLATDGTLRWKPLGGPHETVLARPTREGFGGDSVLALQQHFIDCLERSTPFESGAADYLKTLRVVEASYLSAEENRIVPVSS